jgi:hypothetical protein
MCVRARACGIVRGTVSAHVKSETPISIKEYVVRDVVVMDDAVDLHALVERRLIVTVVRRLGWLVEPLDGLGEVLIVRRIQRWRRRAVVHRGAVERTEPGRDAAHICAEVPPNTASSAGASGKRIGSGIRDCSVTPCNRIRATGRGMQHAARVCSRTRPRQRT